MPSYWDNLPYVTARVHLMTGRLDTKFTALGVRVANVLRCQLTVVEGVGHNLVLEAPDCVVSALREGITS
jgi:pimeloyl-ACP methyl ester carboxylesterase